MLIRIFQVGWLRFCSWGRLKLPLKVKVKSEVAQSWLTLSDPMNRSLPHSSIHGIFQAWVLAAAKSLQSCPTLCNPIDVSPPGSPVPGILQARTLEWVAMSFSNAWKWSRSVVSNPQRPHGLQPSRLLHPWHFPGKSTGVGCNFLLQRIFLTQESNPVLPHCRQILYHLSHQGSPNCH